MMRLIGVALVVTLFVVISACGGDSDSESQDDATSPPGLSDATTAPGSGDATSPPAASAPTSAPADDDAFDPATASDEEKKARYLELAQSFGVEERLLISEAVVADQIIQIAEVQCENTVEDFVGFFQGMAIIEEDLDPIAANRAALLDAFCPDARPTLEEAAASQGIAVPPAE